mmetsp:Transcript_49213/g.105928  ORF Transcript_49213/g.105928 Transcript_49213/m.105928 type:complete len:592 (-) Transcript_49213:7-1782(-)
MAAATYRKVTGEVKEALSTGIMMSAQLTCTKGHGIPPISKDPGISIPRRRLIAALRSIVLTIILGSAGAALFLVRGVVFRESVIPNALTLVLDLCEKEGSVTELITAGANPQGHLRILKDRRVKVVTFNPVGELADDLKIPSITYYESEEFRTWGYATAGYSLGLFEVNHHVLNVTFPGKVGEARKCIHDWAEKHLLSEDSHPAAEILGEAIAKSLKDANRRKPHDWSLTVPVAHGALLLQDGSDLVWHFSAGQFFEKFRPSSAWYVYAIIVHILRVAIAAVMTFLVGGFLHKEWEQALQIWVVQYDYLWEHATGGGDNVDRNMADGKLASTFKHRYQACSLFFIFDHIVKDPQSNTEGLLLGLASAVLDGVLTASIAILPVVQALFFPAWKPVAFGLSGLHFLMSIIFGCSYYFALHVDRRIHLFRAHMLCVCSLSIYSIIYITSIILFLVSRLVVEPSTVCEYVLAVGTVLAVATAAPWQLSRMRQTLIKEMQEHSKGHTIRLLRFIGLDLRSIFLLVSGILAVVVLIAAMCLLAEMMDTEPRPLTDFLTSLITPVAGLATTLHALQKKKEQISDVAQEVTGQSLASIF